MSVAFLLTFEYINQLFFMKKLLFKSLFVASLFVSINSLKAQCSLDQVGAANFITPSALSDVAIAPNKVLYTIAFNTTAGKYQLHSGMTSSSWTLTATLTGSTSIKPAIHINKAGKVSVFVRDDNAGGVGKVYYLSGAVLLQQGSTVKKWNSGSSVWAAVGSGVVSPGVGAFNSLIVTNSNMPVLAFQDGTQTNKTTVMKYNGAAWVLMSTLGANATNSKIKLASNGDFYLGYTETGGNTVVQKFDGATWTPVGSAITGLSSGNVFDLELDPVDVPYITGILSTPPYPVAYKYTGVPTWSNVIGGGYLNSATSLNPNIEIDYTGTPYFFYVDQPANNALNVKTLSSTIGISSQPVSSVKCNNTAGTMSLNVVGGVPISYQWHSATTGTFSNAVFPYTNTNTSVTSFTAIPSMNQNKLRCIVNVGCKNIVSNTATLTVVSPSISMVTTNPSCFGSNDGMVSSTPSGGTSPYTYTWSPGNQNTQNISGQYAGTYSVVTTDLNGCTASTIGSLVNPPSINTSFTGNMTICNGANTTLTITASNGVPAYTYSWSPGASLSSTTSSVVTANPTSTQTYTVTVTDSNGCVATNTVMITVNALPVVSAGLDNTICNGGSTMNTATGAHTYTWNPGNFVGANQNVTPFTTTTYTVVGTNTLTGCTNSDFKTVTVNPNPTINAVSNPTTMCVGSTATLTASGAISYTWNPGSITSVTIAVTPTVTTTYTVTGMAGTGCSNTKTVTLNVSPNPTVTALSNPTAICAGSASSLTASGASTYTWNPGSLTGSSVVVSPTTTTNYTVIGRSAAGCINTKTLSLTVNSNPIATASTSGTLTCSATTVGLSSGFAAGATYLWSGPGIAGPTTTQNTSANLPGNYTVTVTNSGTGCSGMATTAVTQNTTAPSPTASNSGTLTCTIATVSVTGTGGGTYSWSGPGIVSGGTTSSATVNKGGIYSLTVTSANGCSATATTAVNQNTTSPSTTASTTGTLTCSTLTVALNGGPVGMNYSWSGPGISGSPTTQNTAANALGIYTLSVTNPVNGCAASATTAVSQNTTPPTASASNSGTLTCTTTTMALSGTGGGTYNWSGPGIVAGSTTANPIINLPGCYNLTVTNISNGCTVTANTCVSQNTVVPTLTVTGTQTLSCASPTVSISGVATPTNCTGAWTGGVLSGATSYTATANAANIYTLTVTNPVNGCSKQGTVQVSPSSGAPVVTNNPVTNTLTCTNTLVAVGISTTVTPVSYSWSGTGIVSGNTTGTITVSSGGVKNYTVTNTVNGCVSMGSQIVSQNTITPTTTASTTGTITCTTSTVNLNSSLAGVNYTWTAPGGGSISSGTNSQNAIAVGAGMYSLTVINPSNGCTYSTTASVSQNTTMPAGLSAGSNQTMSCISFSVPLNGSITTPTNAAFSWTGGVCGSTNTLSTAACAAGIYTLTATNPVNGCTASSTVAVFSNTSIPTINTGSTPTITCASPTATLNTSSTDDPFTSYSWTSSTAGTLSNYSVNNPVALAADVFTVVVTNTLNGCAAMATISVVSDMAVPTASLSSTSATITCLSPTVSITATANPSTVMFSWSPAGGIIPGTENTSSPAFVSPGSYSVSITNTVNGCSFSNNVFIMQDVVMPSISVNASPSTICSGSQSTLTATGAVSYIWSSGPTSSSIVVSPVTSTTYSVTGTGANGCSDVTTLTLTVNSSPVLSVTGNLNICNGSTSNLTASGATS
ncbi:MAG: hypothetical protein K0S26_2758, partial [Bacteroidota bacterium]|nr:hypothetical protein [Bacteroidota bacterium]